MYFLGGPDLGYSSTLLVDGIAVVASHYASQEARQIARRANPNLGFSSRCCRNHHHHHRRCQALSLQLLLLPLRYVNAIAAVDSRLPSLNSPATGILQQSVSSCCYAKSSQHENTDFGALARRRLLLILPHMGVL